MNGGEQWIQISVPFANAIGPLNSVACHSDGACLADGNPFLTNNVNTGVWSIPITVSNSIKSIGNVYGSDFLACGQQKMPNSLPWCYVGVDVKNAPHSRVEIGIRKKGSISFRNISPLTAIPANLRPVAISCLPSGAPCLLAAVETPHWSSPGSIFPPRESIHFFRCIYVCPTSLVTVSTVSIDSTFSPSVQLSCVTALECGATSGDEFLWTDNGGRTWRVERDHASHECLICAIAAPVTCPSRNTCIVGSVHENSILVTHNQGESWKRVYRFPKSGAVTGISCPSRTTCYASSRGPYAEYDPIHHSPGYIAVSGDAGNHWHLMPIPKEVIINGISCFAIAKCFAVGETVTGDLGGAGAAILQLR